MRVVRNVQKVNQGSPGIEAFNRMKYSQKRPPGSLLAVFFTGALLLLSSLASADKQAAVEDKSVLKLEVIDPYIEMGTGPGRGYPIFHVVEQGEFIEILTRRPGWYEVRARNGRTGWTPASQVARTLQPSGEPVDLPSVSYGDYLKNSWRVGFVAGPFTSGILKGSDVFSFNLGYRAWSWLGIDLEAGNLYRSDISGDFTSANLLIEPFSRWRLSPVLIVGKGSMKTSSHEARFDGIGEFDFDTYGFGLHYYLGRNLVVRSELRAYSATIDNKDERLETWQIGFNTFF